MDSQGRGLKKHLCYSVLLELWDGSLVHFKDTEMKARIQGVASQMQRFEFFFGVCLGFLFLKHTDNLSRALQKEDISAAEGKPIADMTVSTLKSLRCDIYVLIYSGRRPLLLLKQSMYTLLPYQDGAKFLAGLTIAQLPLSMRQ